MSLGYSITCSHLSSLLNKKNLFVYFDDMNGIGTAQYLLEQALSGTGWTLGFCETFLESDGITEKIRSLKADEKRGAYMLITDICTLFGGYPVFHGDNRTVDVYSLNRHNALMELNFGKNLTNVTRKENTENIVTRLYVEGEYTDYGYVGIDDVNPTGLPFLFDFSYYKELGIFKENHQQALDRYILEAQTIRREGMTHSALALTKETELIQLWGQIDYVLYVLAHGAVERRITGGDASGGDIAIAEHDELVVLKADGTYDRITATINEPAFDSTARYAIKFLTKPTAIIGGKEVAVESKQIMLDKLIAQWQAETSETKRGNLEQQIASLEQGILTLFHGNEEGEGLYALMARAAALAVEASDANNLLKLANGALAEAEIRLADVLGDMLRDGYWSNTSYAPGQEKSLYLDALEIMAEVAKPSVSYTVTIQNLSDISGYEAERFRLFLSVRLWDELLRLNDFAYVSKLAEHLDAPHKDSITISNEAIRIGSSTLESIMRKISMVAEMVNRKNALYDRAAAISPDGTIPMQRLEGTIDILKNRLYSSVSNWYTDENGNIMLESLDGKCAMMLCGEGFMIASSKDNAGKWNWRTFGTGEGFTADAIIAGYLSADRIEAHTITANKLAADVGQSLDLSSNKSISLVVDNVVGTAIESAVGEAVGYRVEIIPSNGSVLSDYVAQTTLEARVWRGSKDVTDDLPASAFRWRRTSSDATSDLIWDAAHANMKSITVGKADVYFTATYRCDIVI